MRAVRPGPVLAAVAVVAAGALLAVGRAPVPAPAAVGATGYPARRTAERTVTLGPGSGFIVQDYAGDAGGQQLSVLDPAQFDPAQPGGRGTAEIRVADPGTLDADAPLRGSPVVIVGHDARYLGDPAPTLAWRGSSGARVTVTGLVDPPALLRLARAVRLTPPVPVAGPVGLTWLPVGLTLTSVQIGNGTAQEVFTARGRRSFDVRLSAFARNSTEWINGTVGLGAPTGTVGGHPAWYSENTDDDSQLLVEAGSCGLRVQVGNRYRIPHDMLTWMVQQATIGSCDDVLDWPPVLSS